MNKIRKGFKGGEKKYFVKLSRSFRKRKGKPAQVYQKFIEDKADWFAEGFQKYTIPLQGNSKLRIKGLVYLGIMALTGNKKLKNFLKDTDKIIKGEPIQVIVPSRLSLVKRRLRNELLYGGRNIIRSNYHPEIIHT